MKHVRFVLLCLLCVLLCMQCAAAAAGQDDAYEGWDETESLTEEESTTAKATTTTEPVYTTTTTTTVTTTEPPKEVIAPIVRITRQTMTTKPKADELFSVIVQIQNFSSSVSLMQGTAVFEPGEGLILAEKSDTKVVPVISPNEIVRLELHLRAKKEYTVNDVPVQVTYNYSYRTPGGIVDASAANKLMIALQPAPKEDESAASNATPNIIVSRYSYGDMIAAGDSFTLQLEFTNTSARTAVENIMMSVSSGDGVSIQSASNTYYYASLAAGQTQRQSIPMRVLNTADAQGVRVGIEFKYEYVDKNTRSTASTSENLSIPIYVRDRFRVEQPDTDLIGTQNEELPISIPYVNKGKTAVSNVHAELIFDEEAASCEQPQLNLGNFDAGKSGTIDFYITPLEPGDGEVQIVITYEDELQKEKSKTVTLHYTVEEMYIPTEEEFEMPEEEEGGLSLKTILWIAIPAAVVLILVIVLIVRHKKKKKKKEDMSESFDWSFAETEEQTNEND